MQKLILATRNPGKLREIKAILHDLRIEVSGLDDYPDLPDITEDGETLEENALKKSREVFKVIGLPTLADDTGLEVFYLRMAPGVISARYAGEKVSYEANNKKILSALQGVPPEQRGAQFRCIAAFIADDVQKTAEGICPGKIIEDLRGSGGFGYDPLFVPDGYDQTFAQLPPEIKNQISHRAIAFRKIKTFLSIYFSH